jgi:agarase
MCGARAREAGIIGWFIDNELRFGPDWRGSDELLTLFLNLAPSTPGRSAAVAFLHERHRDFDSFNVAWRTPARTWSELEKVALWPQPCLRNPPYERDAAAEAKANRAEPHRARFAADCDAFLALVAERYFALTASAIRAVDGNHLVLGSRFAYPPPPSVIDAAGRHADIVSFNCYGDDPSGAIAAYARTGRPLLIGEFSFRAADSGLPNTIGAAPIVATQTERAIRFRRYAETALRHPAIVGYHWFEHADQPAEGRFDGENSNYGTVTIGDRVYEALTRAMTEVNAAADTVHAEAARPTT